MQIELRLCIGGRLFGTHLTTLNEVSDIHNIWFIYQMGVVNKMSFSLFNSECKIFKLNISVQYKVPN